VVCGLSVLAASARAGSRAPDYVSATTSVTSWIVRILS
jgi:hypothetical protein